MKEDHQRERLYAWERKYISSNHKRIIEIKEARQIVNIVWADYGFYVTPLVDVLAKPYGDTIAQANRWKISIQPEISIWVIYHEMAHTMILTSNKNDGHGKNFLGIYFSFLTDYLKEDLERLITTASEFNLEYNFDVIDYCRSHH
jgi:hypothetical protein